MTLIQTHLYYYNITIATNLNYLIMSLGEEVCCDWCSCCDLHSHWAVLLANIEGFKGELAYGSSSSSLLDQSLESPDPNVCDDHMYTMTSLTL